MRTTFELGLENEPEQALRILIGDFGSIGALGLREFFGGEGFAVETNGSTVDEVLARVAEGGTDVVVLDRQMPGAVAAAEQIGSEHPDVKVIVCSLDEPTMHVFPAWGGRSYESPLDADRLATAVRAAE